MKDNSPIFIVGCGRSGTTLLRLMLNKHSSIAIPEETWFFVDLDNEKETLLAGNWRLNVSNRIMELSRIHFPDIDKKDIDEVLSTFSSADWPSIVAAINISFARKEGKERWGDKTPGYVIHLPLIKKLYPQAKIIHIIRDGRDVVPSLLKRWNVGPPTDSFIETTIYWKHHVNSGKKIGPTLFEENYFELKYEDLIQNPEYHLRKICQFIDVEFEEEMLNTYKGAEQYVPKWEWHNNTQKPIQKDRVSLWKNGMSKYELFLFNLIAGKLLLQLKYEKSKGFDLKAFKDYSSHRINHIIKKIILNAKVFVYRSLMSLKYKTKY